MPSITPPPSPGGIERGSPSSSWPPFGRMKLPPTAMSDDDRARLSPRCFVGRIPSDIPLETRVEEASSIHEEILRQAGAIGADLWARKPRPIGSSGCSSIRDELLIHKAECPTLVVPRVRQTCSDVPCSSYSLSVDFSELEPRAGLRDEPATRPRASTVVNVIEMPPSCGAVAPDASTSIASARPPRLLPPRVRS